MQEIAIVGGGLSGLALALRLTEAGQPAHLYDARDRLGGRILTHLGAGTGHGADLGPAWIWPDDQPELADLVADLDLTLEPQFDEGDLLRLTDPETGAERAGAQSLHAGACRVAGGMTRLVQALAERIGPQAISLGMALSHVEDRGDHVRLTFQTPDGRRAIDARRAVLAIPPRLLAQNVGFTPDLPDSLRGALAQTPTWMATQARAVAHYRRATWRAEGLSGSAFLSHDRAVLAETFDLSGPGGAPAALGGFLALDPDQRAAFAGGLPLLVENQPIQLFGTGAGDADIALQDWAAEPFTCSRADLADPGRARRAAGHPLLRRALWGGRLCLAGSETARLHPGHLAGALEAAERVFHQMERAEQVERTDVATWLAGQHEPAFALYQRALNGLLSRQRAAEATRVASRHSMALLFERALDQVDLAPGAPEPRTETIARVKPALREALNQLIGRVIGFNRSSCALRNFPDEHRLPDAYLQLILHDASTLGRGFLNELDALLAASAGDP